MKLRRWLSAFVLTAVLCLFSCWPLSATPAKSAIPSAAQAPAVATPATSSAETTIPGPIRSFLRMAGISQKVSPEEILPFFARNIVVNGYQGPRHKESKPTEFLILLKRYLDQAAELRRMAGAEGVLRISNCAAAQPLLLVLGYRLRQECGPGTALEIVDADRAFITVDSGFPLADLEETVRGGAPFAYPYRSSQVPVLFGPSDWTVSDKNDKSGQDKVLDALLSDPALARLYWALSRIDGETRIALQKSPGLGKLLPFAATLDFYGSHISIR
jgi:hypothetical protein